MQQVTTINSHTMTCIVVSENEIVKAEMERPDENSNDYLNGKSLGIQVINFQQHCLSLPRIPIKGKHKWKLWQTVEEGKDFEWKCQVETISNDVDVWRTCTLYEYNIAASKYRRIIAIPIQPTPEGEKVEERIKLQPIRVRNLSMPYDVFVSIKNYTLHNNTVVADTLFQAEDDIEADFFHSKETNIRVKSNYAGDLVIRLLRMGIMVHFLDDSAKHVQKISPPLYSKYYATQQR